MVDHRIAPKGDMVLFWDRSNCSRTTAPAIGARTSRARVVLGKSTYQQLAYEDASKRNNYKCDY